VMGGHGNEMISRALRLSVGFTYAGIFSMSGRVTFAICFSFFFDCPRYITPT